MSKKTALDNFQPFIPAGRPVKTQMSIGLVGGDTASRSTLYESLLYKERLINLLD